MIKTIVTTTDSYDEFTAYMDENGTFYMDETGLNEFFSPYDVRILQAGQLGNDTESPKAIIYMENETILESSPCFYRDLEGMKLVTVYDMGDFELMEREYQDIQTKDTAYEVAYSIEHNEARAMRRQWINTYIHDFMRYQRVKRQSMAKYFVRSMEVIHFGVELQAYK